MGLIYEDHSNSDSTWAIKSHFPLYEDNSLKANKAIVLVRNPMDTIWSLFNA